jgi:hypothetical protein
MRTPFFSRSTGPRRPSLGSVLLHGSEGAAMDRVARAVATLASPELRGASFRAPGRPPLAEPADPSAFTLPEGPDRQLSQWVVRESLEPTERQRLERFLGLPVLLQRLASAAGPGPAPCAILLAHIEELGADRLAETLERSSLHETLREEEVTLVATFSGVPPSSLRDAFGSVLRIEQAAEDLWQNALLTVERGTWAAVPHRRAPLYAQWTKLGFDPSGLRP